MVILVTDTSVFETTETDEDKKKEEKEAKGNMKPAGLLRPSEKPSTAPPWTKRQEGYIKK